MSENLKPSENVNVPENGKSPEEMLLENDINQIKSTLETLRNLITGSGLPMGKKITLREDIDLIEEQIDEEL